MFMIHASHAEEAPRAAAPRPGRGERDARRAPRKKDTNPDYPPFAREGRRYPTKAEIKASLRSQAEGLVCALACRDKSGVLSNGVRWRFSLPTYDQARAVDSLILEFSDPRTSKIMMNGKAMSSLAEADITQLYQQQLEIFALDLARKHMEPAGPLDPDGFFVKWKRAAS